VQKKNNSSANVQLKRKPRRKKACPLCVDKVFVLDYKDLNRLSRFITDRGKIVPKRNSGACAKHQRMVAESVKRSRFIGFIPYCID